MGIKDAQLAAAPIIKVSAIFASCLYASNAEKTMTHIVMILEINSIFSSLVPLLMVFWYRSRERAKDACKDVPAIVDIDAAATDERIIPMARGGMMVAIRVGITLSV